MIQTKTEAEQLLGLSSAYTPKQLMQARRKMLMEYHPDHNSSPDANQLTRDINSAYKMLKSYAFNISSQENGKSHKIPKIIYIPLYILMLIWTIKDVIIMPLFKRKAIR